MIGIKPRRSTPYLVYSSNLASTEGHFTRHRDWNGFLTKAVAFCVAAAVSVSTLSGAVLVLVTFHVFSHHLRCGRGLCLTFEAPSSSPLDEQQPAHLTFMSAFTVPLTTPPLSSLQPTLCWLLWTPVSSADKLDLLLSLAPQRAGWPLQPVSRYRLADKDGKGEQTVWLDFQTVKKDSFTAERPGTPLCWAMPHITVALCVWMCVWVSDWQNPLRHTICHNHL